MAFHNKLGLALQGFGAGVQGRGQQFTQNLDETRKQALLEDAFTVQQQLQSGDTAGARLTLIDRLDAIKRFGGNDSDTMGILNKIEGNDLQGAFNDVSTVVDFGVQSGRLANPAAQNQRKFALQASSPQVDPKTGQIFRTVFDPNENTTVRVDVEGALGETPGAKTTREIGQVGKESAARSRSERASLMKQEIGDRNRLFSRQLPTIQQALTAAQNATEGLAGTAKLALSRVFPGIDVADLAQLESATTQLALDFLQSFKGPTTDFEFKVVQTLAGGVGNARSNNIARLNSVKRSAWFGKREQAQLTNWLANNKDPDQFAFDFEEQIKTRQGTFSLQQLQNTAVKENLTIEQTLGRLNRGG